MLQYKIFKKGLYRVQLIVQELKKKIAKGISWETSRKWAAWGNLTLMEKYNQYLKVWTGLA
jgi:hypothetical protein